MMNDGASQPAQPAEILRHRIAVALRYLFRCRRTRSFALLPGLALKIEFQPFKRRQNLLVQASVQQTGRRIVQMPKIPSASPTSLRKLTVPRAKPLLHSG